MRESVANNSHTYLPVDETAIESGLYVTGYGQTHVPKDAAYPPDEHPGMYMFKWATGRVLPEYAVVLISSGAGEFESSSACCRFEAPRLIFLSPGVWHRYRPLREVGWQERWVCFSGAIAASLFTLKPFGPAPPIPQPVDNVRPLQHAFDHILAFPAAVAANDRSLLAALLQLLSQLFLAAPSSGAPPLNASTSDVPSVNGNRAGGALLARARRLIWTRSHHRLTPTDVARALNVSRRTLERRFADSEGGSLHDEITRCRVGRAARLLVETRLGIKQVAYMAGFPSPERMRVAFQGSFGMSPKRYREARGSCC